MELPKVEIACDCGKTYRIRPRAVAGEMICVKCDRRVSIPASPNAALADNGTSASKKKWSFDLKSFVSGLLMTIVGVVGAIAFFWCLNAGTTGRGMIYLPIFSLVFIVMGLTFLTKGLFGDLIELE